MGGESTKGPTDVVQTKSRGYLGQGPPGLGIWSSVPFDATQAQRQQLAAQESKQYDPKQYASEVEDWLKQRQKDPKKDISNPPFPTDPGQRSRSEVLQKGQQILRTLRGFYGT